MALEEIAQGTSRLDGLLALETDLDQAEAARIVLPLAESDQRFFTSEAGRAYLPVLRDRLFRLGYLRVRKGPDQVDETLTKAIRKLQAEAGLTVDGWVGIQTWNALQELFAFEPTTCLDRWIDAKGMTPALRRAACLRLISLGFIPGRTTAGPGDLAGPLHEWRHILVLLEAPGISAATGLDTLELLTYLFDIDRLSTLVDEAAGHIAMVMTPGDDTDGARLQRFLGCLLKIELWLLGYEHIKPDGKPLEIRREPARRRGGVGPKVRQRRAVDSPGYRLIQRFWRDSGFPGEHGSAGHVLLQCFRLLAQMRDDVARSAPDEQSERKARAGGIISQLEETHSNDETHWQQRAFLARIWDGAKRVWRFLKKLVKGALSRIRLLIRAAYQLAADGFSLVRRAIRVFGEGMAMLTSPQIAGSNRQIAMRHSADFDFQVFLDRETENDAVKRFLEQLERRLGSLRSALRMLQLLFDAAVDAVRLASGPWGWWRLLRALIDLNGRYDERDKAILQASLTA